MKAGIFALAAATLLQLAAAQPHRQRHHHEKRDGTPVVVLYYHPGEDKPYSTGYEVPAATPASNPAAVAPSPATTSAGSAPVSSSGGSGSSGSSSSGLSITYTPYDDNGGCIQDSNAIKAAFDRFSGYKSVRLYGTDCNQVANILPIAKAKGMKIFQGVFHIDQVQKELQTIIDAAKGDWDVFDTISIGNEIVQSGAGSPDQVVAALSTARDILGKAGFKGSIVTVDTAGVHNLHPELCKASDYCAVNCHAFFDPNTSAKNAGQFVLSQAQSVAQKAGKKVVITESGWPWNGNGSPRNSAPSQQEQSDAISSLKNTFSSDLFLFSATDDKWKKDTDKTFGAEKFWGVKNL